MEASSTNPPTRAVTGITSLATELILQIISHLDPASHLNFALASRYLFQCSQQTLDRHQKAHETYSTASDLHPATVPHLVLSALGLSDPIDAWHVRSLEIWGERTEWNDWDVPLDWWVDGPSPPSPRKVAWSFTSDERRRVLESFRRHVPGWAVPMVEKELKRGDDGFLKMILIAMCPRLRDLKIVRTIDGNSPLLEWLPIIIRHIDDPAPWPPGLAGLTTVSVGLPTEDWIDPPDDHWPRRSYPGAVLEQLLRLPNIDSLYFAHLDQAPIGDDWIDTFIVRNPDPFMARRSSSVRHLFLADEVSVSLRFQEALLEAPRNLVSLSLHGDAEFDSVVGKLARAQAHSLESLMRHRTGGMGTGGCELYRPRRYSDPQMEKLRHFAIDVERLEEYAQELRHGHKDAEVSDEALLAKSLQGSVPREALVLFGACGRRLASNWDGSVLDGALAAMIDSGEFPNFKAVYLEGVWLDHVPGEKRDWFGKTLAAAERANVDVYMQGEAAKRIHKIDFPVPPSKYDLKYGPSTEQRKEDWVFQPYDGGLWPPRRLLQNGQSSSEEAAV